MDLHTLARTLIDIDSTTGHEAGIGEFLFESDLVKFARHLPTIADSERAWGAAKRFVDETTPPTTVPVEERRAAG